MFPQKLRQLCRPENKKNNTVKQPEQYPLNPDNGLTPVGNEYKGSSGAEMDMHVWESSDIFNVLIFIVKFFWANHEVIMRKNKQKNNNFKLKSGL